MKIHTASRKRCFCSPEGMGNAPHSNRSAQNSEGRVGMEWIWRFWDIKRCQNYEKRIAWAAQLMLSCIILQGDDVMAIVLLDG
mgnify:CR=1 FL=1